MAGKRIDDIEKDAILTMFEDGASLNDVKKQFGRDIATLSRLRAKYHPQTRMARRTLMAGSVKLAERVLKHANVEEAIEVLSRPNIGVLEPIRKNEEGPQVLISVSPGSLGGVKQVGGGLTDGAQKVIEAGSKPHQEVQAVENPTATPRSNA